VVNGNDAELAALGVHYLHDQRYDFSREYWDAFRRIYAGDRSGYQGEFVQIAPRGEGGAPMSVWAGPHQPAGVPLWGAGTSAPGVAHSVELLDTYLSFANTPPLLGEKFRRVGAEAAKIGRKLDYGTRLQVIVRETEEEAWAHAAWLLAKSSVEQARRAIEMRLPPARPSTPTAAPIRRCSATSTGCARAACPMCATWKSIPMSGSARHGSALTSWAPHRAPRWWAAPRMSPRG
jgi:alkanesulfonate monooxygenase